MAKVKGSKITVGDIAGGQAPLKRDVGANLTINHVWSMYRWYPGFRDLLNLEVDAIFSNGINEDEIIDTTRLMECKESLRWALMAGYSIVIVDARDSESPKIEAWHPYIDGVGFNFTSFSSMGHPLEIEIYMKANETASGNIHYNVEHYPCEVDIDGEYIDSKPIPGGKGFFHMRTQGNIRGIQGLPQYMHLIDTFKIQWDIIKAYGPFAEKQGMAFPVFYHADNSPTNRARVKNQFATQPTTNRLLQMSVDDLVEWVSPQSGAYDPFPMLHWLNTILSRASQMNKLMIEGEGAGQLSTSETAINRWETKQKEKQSYWKTQFLGVWMALGASKEVNFKDPAHPTFISLMEGLKALREAMDGIIEPEDIVNLMNEYLESNDQKRELHALSKEEMMGFNESNEQGQDSEHQSDNKGD